MGLIEKRQFLFGMDFDSEERLLPPGFSRKNLNVRVGSSVSDGVGSVENTEGNTFIPNLELPDGDNKVIGAFWYKEKDLNYHFVWNDKGNHGIYEYNHVSSKIVKVLQGSELNFQKDSLITGVNVVKFDDSSDLLYWVDKANPPRKINIQKAKSDGYSSPLTQEVMDAIKYPPLCPVTGTYFTDDSRKVNYLNDQIWQFKAAYVYDDKEQSAWSPISVQILPNTIQGNTIKLIIPKGGELVERVLISGRKGNLFDFVLIEDQEVSKFELDVDGNYVFNFSNDGSYTVIDINQSIKQYDRVPQIAGAQEFVQNKIVYADVTEGYDNVDVDLDVNVKYEEEVSTTINTIKGYVRISNDRGSGDDSYKNNQPIHNYNGTYVYGGFGNARGGLGIPDEFEANLADDFKQTLPLGGFVIYLAGTDHYAISKQILGNQGASKDSNNVFYSDTRGQRNDIRDEMVGASSGPYTGSRTWSTFELDNVPDGTYIMRVASNLTTESDLQDPSRGYQKTSAFLNRIGNGVSNGQAQEDSKELRVTVQGGQILEDIEIVIADLTDPDKLGGGTRGLAGYMTDPVLGTSFSSIDEILGEKRIELAAANVTSTSTNFVPVDHNGFFFRRIAGGSTLGLQDFKSGTYQTSNFDAYDLFQVGSPTPVTPENTTNGTTKFFVVTNKDQRIKDYSRTNIRVKVRDSLGNPVNDVYVALRRGDTQKIVSGGETTFKIYAPSGETFRSTDLYFYYDENISHSFTPSTIPLSGYIGPGSGQLNDGDETLLQTVTINFTDISNQARLKNGSVYDFGIVYYDRANRSGDVNFGKELSLPFYTEGSSIIKTAPIVDWEISNTPPEWATHYQIVRTKNTAVNQYIQWGTGEVSYLDDSGSPSNYNDGTIIKLDITNLTDEYKKANPDSVLVYDFVKGDRIRMISDSKGAYFEEYIDLKVLGFDSGVLEIENFDTSTDYTSGLFFEIYTPKLDVEEDIYYEIGECFEIGEYTTSQGDTIRIHKGATQDQTDTLPATGIFKGGDTYYRKRDITTSGGSINASVDSQLFSDSWDSKVSDIGRPQRINKYAQRVTRPTTIYHSDNFVPDTNINGLNSFFDDYFETYDRNYGTIKKLFEVNGRLDVYHELQVAKVYVEESVVYNQSGQGNIGIADPVLSFPSQVYSGEFGTMNPESFTENEGRRYFFDVRNGAVVRLSNDGMTAISDNKMHSYFESKSNFYSAFDQIPEVWGVYDENFDEYVINFGSISRPEGFSPDDLALVSSQAETVTEEINGLEYTFFIGYSENDDGVPTEFEIVRDVANGTYEIVSRAGDITLSRQELLTIPAETLGYSERTGHWTSFYDYTPECMSRVGIDFLTFKRGRAYLHNSNPSRNQFYGVNYPSEVWAVFNQEPSVIKVYNALATESDTIWIVREMLTNKGQKSSLIESDFQDDNGNGLVFDSKEGIHYAAILKDENTPNVDIPIIEGDDMRDASILIKFVNDSTEQERLFATHVNFSPSFRSNK